MARNKLKRQVYSLSSRFQIHRCVVRPCCQTWACAWWDHLVMVVLLSVAAPIIGSCLPATLGAPCSPMKRRLPSLLVLLTLTEIKSEIRTP